MPLIAATTDAATRNAHSAQSARGKSVPTSPLDKAGATASLICAVHCVTVPLALAILPALGLAWLDNPWVDRSFFGLAFLFAALAHPKGYKQHGRCVPAFIALFGLVLIGCAIAKYSHVEAHHYLIAGGGLLLAGSHWLNQHFCHNACCERHGHH